MKIDKKTIIIAAVSIVVIIVLIALGLILTNDSRQEAKLRKEVEKINSLDITKDDVDMKIRTSGDYAKVEETIKQYMNTYATTLKEIDKMLDDSTLSEILTSENYKNDAPEFTKSLNFITSTRENFNEEINVLIDMSSEEMMLEKINEKGLDEKYVELYKELMLNENIKNDLSKTVDSLRSSGQMINSILDIEENVINLLVQNEGKWNVNEDGEIEFSAKSLVDKYNEYLSEL